jgi:hypothetical protein
MSLFAFIMATGYSQVTNQGKPASWRQAGMPEQPAYIMPEFDLEALQAEDKINDAKQNKPYRFGHEFFVDHTLNNSGVWTTLPNGDRIWRMRYYSAGAHTLNFLFTDFFMPKGATLYLYNTNKTDLLGAYDEKQNNKEHVLGTWLVQGNDIWIEYYEPAAVTGQGKLEIFKVVHGYRTINTVPFAGDSYINSSADCMYDVDCYVEGINNLKDINKRSVALVIVNNSAWCTGSLINNTNNDGTPYFLTANHCYSDPAQWAFMFNWRSPEPVCAAAVNSTNNAPGEHFTISGSALRARKVESDFLLLEITSPPPAEWNLVWSGWDRSLTVPPLVYGIHHPSGDIMKVSVDYHAPSSRDTDDGTGFVWDLPHFDIGGIEGGSSGSPLFDNNGRIRGQCWFGTIGACSGTDPVGQIGGYGRLDHSWDAGPSPESRLKEWLDPGNTGALTTDFYPTFTIRNTDAAVLFAGLQEECSGVLTPVLRLVNYGNENLTSVQLTYTIDGEPQQQLNWTGNLALNESALIEFPEHTLQAGVFTAGAVVTFPNGTTDDDVTNNTTGQNVIVSPQFNTQPVTLSFLTDNYPEETSWELTNQEGELLYSATTETYEETQLYTQVFNLPEGCYTFAVHDAYSDGICCAEGEGYFVLTTQEGEIIGQGSDYNAGQKVKFRLEGALGQPAPIFEGPVRVYPNPSTGLFAITSPDKLTSPKYKVYNVLGQLIQAGDFGSEAVIDLSHAENGIYLLTLDGAANEKNATFKLIKE